MMNLSNNTKYLHKDGTIHIIKDRIGDALYMEVWGGNSLLGEYSTALIDNMFEDGELASKLTPYGEGDGA
jgi:hypothetical protein